MTVAISQDPVVIACAANAAYSIPLTVMLRSAIDHLAPDRELIVWVIEDGCRAVELAPGDGERAFAAMREAGATIVESGTIGP